MITPRFVTIHTLHGYSNALVNRDNSGMAKRCTIGDSIRTRISSQCLKRHWLEADNKYSMESLAEHYASYRSRLIVEKLVIAPLKEELEPNPAVLEKVQDTLIGMLYTENGVHNVDARQSILLGEPEVNFLLNGARKALVENPDDPDAAATDVKEIFNPKGPNFRTFIQQVQNAIGTKTALFGRMSTSDHYSGIDGAIHVSHSSTVHAEETESDFFSSLDDLATRPNSTRPQSSHIGEVEINSGIYYGCVVVDIPQLVSNLEGCSPKQWHQADRTMAGNVVHNLIYLISLVTPAAKLGSTAAYGKAQFMLVETGDTIPTNYANAYQIPSEPNFQAAADQLANFIQGQDNFLGLLNKRRFGSSFETSMPQAEKLNLDQLAVAIKDAIQAGTDE